MTSSTRTSLDYIALEDRLGAHNYHPLDVVLTRGEGVWVWDVDGRKYLDCLASYSAVNQGHSHPRILQALVDQASRLSLTSRAFRNDKLPLLYEKLHALTGFERFLMMNSGAEAVETAVKAARKWGYETKGIAEGKARIVVAEGNFHGRTTTVVSFSTDAQYRKNFGPFTPGFDVVAYGSLAALEAAITPDTAAFLVEPIQAEAGILVPPDGYLREAARICQERGVLLILDEIQTGLGRTGKTFAWEWEDARPDMVLIGKALSGGFYPVSCVLSSSAILGLFRPGDHGSTFGGNPLGCAVALAALDVLVEEHLADRARDVGDYFRKALTALNHPSVLEIRGRGLLIGVKLRGRARPVAEALQRRGILVKDTHGTILRFTPPLVITEDEVDVAVEALKAALDEVAEGLG